MHHARQFRRARIPEETHVYLGLVEHEVCVCEEQGGRGQNKHRTRSSTHGDDRQRMRVNSIRRLPRGIMLPAAVSPQLLLTIPNAPRNRLIFLIGSPRSVDALDPFGRLLQLAHPGMARRRAFRVGHRQDWRAFSGRGGSRGHGERGKSSATTKCTNNRSSEREHDV